MLELANLIWDINSFIRLTRVLTFIGKQILMHY